MIVCLCLCAVSIFNRYLENLSQFQMMAVAMGVTLVIVSYWPLAGHGSGVPEREKNQSYERNTNGKANF